MKILLLNQCFYPDVVSTAQHLTDLATGLANNGHEVTVVAGDRGYDNPANRFPKRETWKGITIIRVPSLSLGKQSKWRRAMSFASFLFSSSLRLMFLSRFDVVVCLTSPPLISYLGSLFARLKGGRLIFWVMDLNPDEAVAAGWLKEHSLTAGILRRLLQDSLEHAERIIVLDRFMKERIAEKGIPEYKLVTIAPWSHSDEVAYDVAGRSDFRAVHGLSEKFVVMYSGNHSPCHPLDTLLQAADRLADNSQIAFCFVGGGSEHLKVNKYAHERGLGNVICLPYQPLEKLAGSLSAADLHVVVMGNSFAGIVHPCKVYNILEVGTPFLYIGPEGSHVVDLMLGLGDSGVAFGARHGDVEAVSQFVLAQSRSTSRPRTNGQLAASFSKDVLLPQMLAHIEGGTAAGIGPIEAGLARSKQAAGGAIN